MQPHGYRYLTSENRVVKMSTEIKTSTFFFKKKVVWGKLEFNIQKNKTRLIFFALHKNQLKVDQRL